VLRIQNKSFLIRFRIRILPEVSFGSGFESGFNPEFESRSESRIRIQIKNWPNFFVLKFLPSLIFKHKKAAFRQLRDLATNKVRNKFAGYGSWSNGKRQNLTYPQLCVQLLLMWNMYNRMKLPYFGLKIRLLFTDFFLIQIRIWIRNVYFCSGSDPAKRVLYPSGSGSRSGSATLYYSTVCVYCEMSSISKVMLSINRDSLQKAKIS
jgi:ribosomal protein S17E